MNLNEAILLLKSIKGIGRKTIITLCDEFDTDITVSNLFERVGKIKKASIDYETFIEKLEDAKKIIIYCNNTGINIVNYKEKDYPIKLFGLKDPPVLLFYKGSIAKLNQHPSIAVVGTREPSEYGVMITKLYTKMICEHNINIVSGLAKGIDTIAQSEALSHQAYTAAFLAHGLDTPIYPKENHELAERILASNGALISEYLPDAKPLKGYFVERDRLQSGSSDAVLVIETGIKGGTMHAAKSAIELKRLLSAFNHPEKFRINNPKSEGNQLLIEDYSALPIYSEQELKNLIDEVNLLDETFKRNSKGTHENLESTIKQISFDI